MPTTFTINFICVNVILNVSRIVSNLIIRPFSIVKERIFVRTMINAFKMQTDGQLHRYTCVKSVTMVLDVNFHPTEFIFSLDPILGYNIKPKAIVKVSVVIILLLFIFGLINGIFSVLTFGTKKVRKIGCGHYLLASSIIPLFLVIISVIQFCYLIFSQIEIITNRLLLFVSYVSLDFTLKNSFSLYRMAQCLCGY
jgi:hypothetical protein